MKKIDVKDLRPGMLTAATVFSHKGQLLIPAQTVLSTQHISCLVHYEIENIFIFPEEEVTSALLDQTIQSEDEPKTYSQKIKDSAEFRIFKATYLDKVTFIKKSLNHIITSNKPIEQKQLLSEVTKLFLRNNTTISMFDMLHNMREIDDSTYAHSINVAIIARMIGQWLTSSQEELDLLTLSGILHDIGKCMIDPAIIQKPGRLTAEEYQEVQKHPRLGYDILRTQGMDQQVLYAVLMHHERCDGTGYPLGFTRERIGKFAQIIAIADVYDAMTANRCYRLGLCPFEVIATFEREGLNKYNPHYILTFLEHIADTYQNNNVLLNDSREGKVILLNRHRLSRPVVALTDGTFLNLLEHPDLFIEKIL